LGVGKNMVAPSNYFHLHKIKKHFLLLQH
jgi:hypothetical protein